MYSSRVTKPLTKLILPYDDGYLLQAVPAAIFEKKGGNMDTKALTKFPEKFPTFFDDDFFKPWNDRFNSSWYRMTNIPAANVTESKEKYEITLAVPGMKKSDYRIDIKSNMLTISTEKEESKEEKDRKFTRREFNYFSFSRSFNLPAEVYSEKIEASYENGVLKLTLPRQVEIKKPATKQIAVK